MVRAAWFVVLAGMTSSAALASAQPPDDVRSGAPVAMAMRTAEAIRLDGRLDEPAWQLTRPIGALRQREPAENAEPSEDTVVRIVYNADALYIALVCHDRSPSEIVSTQLTRDADLDVDDRITIVLD